VTVQNLAFVAVGTAVFGVAVPWVVVDYGAAIQLRTPPILQGRVASAAEASSSRRRRCRLPVGGRALDRVRRPDP
jgi:hypothetical protein